MTIGSECPAWGGGGEGGEGASSVVLQHIHFCTVTYNVYLYMYRTASLLRPARCYAPPIFGQNYCIGLFDLHYGLRTAVLAHVRVLQV